MYNNVIYDLPQTFDRVSINSLHVCMYIGPYVASTVFV